MNRREKRERKKGNLGEQISKKRLNMKYVRKRKERTKSILEQEGIKKHENEIYTDEKRKSKNEC